MSIVAKKIMMGSGAVALPSDDQFNRVSFLSHFEGSNNGVNNAFDDGSASNHTITANGNVTQGSFGPFARPDGEWGVSFDGTNDGLRLQSSDFGISTEAFTAECWVFPTKVPDDYDGFMWCMDATQSNASGNTWSLRAYNGKVQIFTVSSGSLTSKESTASLNINAWNHVAISRSGTTMYVALNGTVESATCASSLNNQQYLHIGCGAASGYAYFFQGVISNARYLVGTALYTSDYTVPTGKLTAITNTDLLTCQSNRFVDNSASGHAITITGEPAVTAFGPFLTSTVYKAGTNGASAYFDGSGDYLDTPTGADFELDANYTIEGWFYQTVREEGSALFELNDYRSGILFRLGNASSIYDNWYINGTDYDSPASSFPLNQWNHFAITRSDGSTNRLFANGVQIATASVSGDINSTQGKLRIGGIQHSTGQQFDGYVGDFRLIKGTAVYTSNFTPPTAPLTAISNTKLLLNMADAQAIDSAAQNNLNLFGTAKTSTAQYKFGTASLLLDGNSDYATFPENGANDIDGGGDWTVEFFWRFVNKTSPSIQEIISKGLGIQLYTINGSLGFALSANNSGTYFINNTGGTTLDNDTWYHLALVKNGTSYKLYLNGTSDLSATSSSNIDTGGYPWFLGTISGAESTYASNGYMDEVRISKFARYTSNFTAPTEAFADKGQ